MSFSVYGDWFVLCCKSRCLSPMALKARQQRVTDSWVSKVVVGQFTQNKGKRIDLLTFGIFGMFYCTDLSIDML